MLPTVVLTSNVELTSKLLGALLLTALLFERSVSKLGVSLVPKLITSGAEVLDELKEGVVCNRIGLVPLGVLRPGEVKGGALFSRLELVLENWSELSEVEEA